MNKFEYRISKSETISKILNSNVQNFFNFVFWPFEFVSNLVLRISNFRFQRGQSLVELLLVIGLSSVVLPALLVGFVSSREGKAQQHQRSEAVALLRETIESVRSVREKGWESFAANGTFHPEATASSWTLVTGEYDDPVTGFKTAVVISDVQRGTCPGPDCQAIVATGGIVDPSTKKAQITISWGSMPFVRSIVSTLYMARYLDNNAFTETEGLQTPPADFDLGTKAGTEVTNTSGGEVILGPGSYGDWCAPNLSLASLDLPNNGVANALTAIEGNAFATTGENASGVSFASIVGLDSNPPAPTKEAEFDGHKTNGVFGGTNYAFIATDTNDKEVVIIDLNNIVSGKYQEAGFFDSPGSTDGNSVYVTGLTGFMTAGSTLYSFDLSGLPNTSVSRLQLDSVSLAGTGKEVVINGNYAYVAVDSATKQLQIIDVVDPSNMFVVGQASVGNVAALNFDGNDKATIPDSPSLRPSSAVTVAAWIKPAVLSDTRTVVNKQLSSGFDSYVLGTTQGTKARFCAAETGTNCANGGTLSAGVWQYLTGTFNGATIRTYMNGVEVATLAWTNPLTYSAYPVLIGVEDQGYLANYFYGKIDEVRIYNRALTVAEILAYYNEGFTARLGGSSSQGLVGYWNFDEAAGQTVGDSAGSNNGTLGDDSSVESDDPTWTSVSTGNKGGADVAVSLTGDRTYLATENWAANREFFIIDTSTKTGNRPVIGTYEASGMDPKGVAVVTADNKAIIVGEGGEEYQVINTLTETTPLRCGGIEVNLGIRDIASVIEGDGDRYSYIVTGDTGSEFKIVKGGIGGIYITSGTFESATFDLISQKAFNRFDVSVENLLNTTTEFQVAVKPPMGGSCTGVAFAGSDFVGPSGTSADKFQTTTPTSGIQVFSYVVPFAINPGQCFRYKTYLSTTNFFASPFFHDITVNYSQ